MFYSNNTDRETLRQKIQEIQGKQSDFITERNQQNMKLNEHIKEIKAVIESGGKEDKFELKKQMDLLTQQLHQGTEQVEQAKKNFKSLQKLRNYLKGEEVEEFSDEEVVQLSIGEAGLLLRQHRELLPPKLAVLSLTVLLAGRELFRKELDDLRQTIGNRKDPYDQPDMKALMKLGILVRGLKSQDLNAEDLKQYKKGPLGDLVTKYARFLPDELYTEEKVNQRNFGP